MRNPIPKSPAQSDMTDAATEIRDQIRTFVLGQLAPRGVTAIGDADSLVESGVTDSLGIFQAIDFLERKFRIRVADDEIQHDNFRSIDTMTRFVFDKKHGGPI